MKDDCSLKESLVVRYTHLLSSYHANAHFKKQRISITSIKLEVTKAGVQLIDTLLVTNSVDLHFGCMQ